MSSNSPSLQALLQRWQRLQTELQDDNVTLLAISKYAPDAAVQTLIDAGQRCFGESRPQNLRDRALRWPDCQWHMIGPLQKNKAKYIARHAAMWHSCDDIAIAASVARYLEGRTLPVLVQVNIAGNPDQRGVKPQDLASFVAELAALDGFRIAGLMAMASQDERAQQDFLHMRRLRDELFGGSVALLSMGMSSDYRMAITAGADMVRLGSTLFGDLDIRNNRDDTCSN
ncbi:MAG: YggS family pyridoxal phosphate-dependent enzyme [Mariprofundus sp.]